MKQKRWNLKPDRLMRVGLCIVIGWIVGTVSWGKLSGHTCQAQEIDMLGMQDTIALPRPAYSLLIGGADTLVLPSDSMGLPEVACLKAFFEGLDSLRAGKDTVVSVIHLGDSHIQAGHYSGQMMRLLQQPFGNAGRGWIAPFKLSRSNEPDDYFIKSVVKDWVAGRCIQHTPKTTIGLGGIGIRSYSPSINFDVIITPKNGTGYAFNQAVLYRHAKSMPMLPAGSRKDSVQIFRSDTLDLPNLVADTFRVAALTDTLLLQSTRRKPGTDQLLPASAFVNLYYGLNLTNGQRGILYHSIGVNGAMFVHYTHDAYVQQLALLKPSLLIISLGTNETFGRRFNEAEFREQARAFLQLVKRYLPETSILLTTPPECYRSVYAKKKRTYVRNANTQQAAHALVELARQEKVACWDLFTATGGKNSCRKWQTQQLLSRDRVHFRKEGYAEQGTLLYRSLMHTYNQIWNSKE